MESKRELISAGSATLTRIGWDSFRLSADKALARSATTNLSNWFDREEEETLLFHCSVLVHLEAHG